MNVAPFAVTVCSLHAVSGVFSVPVTVPLNVNVVWPEVPEFPEVPDAPDAPAAPAVAAAPIDSANPDARATAHRRIRRLRAEN
jgi:hypothetical protein